MQTALQDTPTRNPFFIRAMVDDHGSDDLCAPRRIGKHFSLPSPSDGETVDAVKDHLLHVSNTRKAFS